MLDIDVDRLICSQALHWPRDAWRGSFTWFHRNEIEKCTNTRFELEIVFRIFASTRNSMRFAARDRLPVCPVLMMSIPCGLCMEHRDRSNRVYAAHDVRTMQYIEWCVTQFESFECMGRDVHRSQSTFNFSVSHLPLDSITENINSAAFCCFSQTHSNCGMLCLKY